jgi:hypothetical protein
MVSRGLNVKEAGNTSEFIYNFLRCNLQQHNSSHKSQECVFGHVY